ncbi:putative glycerol uptake facilitator [Nocardia nova SH22a]|uniref:Putative glycerol uptake facilitator n=1 Tax=Nocardia nova SH22a TaxID=1415166 RepID=W5T8R9_9NOCA|nr:aquaporin [Nocardia nova]AHH15612.1 putative glycerol uptake facilitator [Nocardia nova SH22a]
MNARTLFAEFLGTATLVFIGVGAATLSFGFDMVGASTSAGVVVTALAFGLVMLILAYAIGPISGAHINPAVTIGFLASGRISITEAVGYWIAQVLGGIAGAAVLRGIVGGAAGYSTSNQGLGADGFGDASMIHLGAGGAFVAEVVLTFIFVAVVLAVTSKAATTVASALSIGFALATVHLVGIPLTGTSVNPARSIGPALFVGGDALSQLWVFILAPLLGGIIAAVVVRYLYPRRIQQVRVEELVDVG